MMQLAPGPRHSQYGNGCPEPSGASWSIHVIAAPGLSTTWSLLPFPVMFPATSCHWSRKATWYSLVHCVHFGPSPSPRLSVLPEAAHLSVVWVVPTLRVGAWPSSHRRSESAFINCKPPSTKAPGCWLKLSISTAHSAQ